MALEMVIAFKKKKNTWLSLKEQFVTTFGALDKVMYLRRKI